MVSSAFSSYLNLKLAGPWNRLDGSYSSKTRTIPLRTVGVVVTDAHKSGIDCFCDQGRVFESERLSRIRV